MMICLLGNLSQPHTSETHHLKSLEALGHKVFPLQESTASAEEILEIARECDLFVWIHTHGWETEGIDRVLKTLRENRIPSLTYHLDLYMGLGRWQELKNGPYLGIDHFFTVDLLMADWLNQKTAVRGHYLPAGVYHEECYQAEPNLDYPDVVFVGSRGYHPEWPYRERLISWLERTYEGRFQHWGGGSRLGSIRGPDLNQLYANAKVVVGDSLCLGFDYPAYWSDRVYETLGRGGFLIHPYIDGLHQEFESDTELVTYSYGNFPELGFKIDHYLGEHELRESIRKAGHEKVKSMYTYKHRWNTILETI